MNQIFIMLRYNRIMTLDKKRIKNKFTEIKGIKKGKTDDNDVNTDHYGFSEDYQYDRTVDYKTKSPKKDLKKIITIILVTFVSIVIIFMLFVIN